MPYATPQDLVDAYGEAELVRLTTPSGQSLAGVVAGRAEARLVEASGLMDSYLRRRYLVPVTPATPELRSCCCALARYELMHTGETEPSEQARLARKERIDWLQALADGRIALDGAALANTAIGARTRDRRPSFTADDGAAAAAWW